MKFLKILTILFSLLLTFSCTEKTKDITEKEYQNAVSYIYTNYNNKTAFNLFTSVNWLKDSSGIWFIDYSANKKTYKTVSFKGDNKVNELFDHKKFAESLNNIVKDTIEENNISISNIQYEEDKNLSFRTNDKTYVLDLNTYNITEKEQPNKTLGNPGESASPDGKWIAYAKDYNLYIKSTTTNKEYPLTTDGQEGYEYATWYGWADTMSGENGKRPSHFYVDWSEDSQWISTSVVDLRNAEKMYLLDASIDSLYRPKLLSYYRGSPGDTTMVHTKPVFFNIAAKKEIKTELPNNTHINSVYIEWTDRSGIAIANYSERGYKKEHLLEVDLNTNTTKPLFTEESETNIDNFSFRQLKNKEKILVLSEKSGWRQLYVIDTKTGNMSPITKGEYYIHRIQHVDEENEIIYFTASGKEQENNPYHQQVYKTTLEGDVTLLTPENTHHSVSFSEDGKYFADNYSTINIPTKTVLRTSEDGKIISELTSADVSDAIAKGWQAPEVFELTAKDGKTTIYGAFWKPTNFDPSKSYPIIDATYTGPHTQRFPKSFNRIFDSQPLAELGFIVIAVDGLGTFGRSKEFHNHSYKNMGNNLEDHVLAIKHLGNKYSWMDTTRVGIYGHSAGGYDTGRAMLAFPDVYKVGVSSSADHDFRMEKAWWPEMYQGWPVDSTYHQISNVTNAKNLKGKLLLVHGGIDENVNPSATYKFAEALINADKEFDLLILPSQRHGYRGKSRDYFIKKRWNYFVEHLGNQTPIWDFKWSYE
ncbi:S9 family peptidase [Aquimarina sp. 2201CG5-10]|uniref:S9 family peptidase n=1 Tax=Aquimarina callyspongiae TaxID=3098150 RepID=UPI002AB551EE|nr:prolyl oligopeptidase family serine peptidase [Aquimarina sp. 2201CG5-10]MDY8134828.1 prolyl oligopeptidase family serine peptidase [Aquimarina sp. 2201CG5-10]